MQYLGGLLILLAMLGGIVWFLYETYETTPDLLRQASDSTISGSAHDLPAPNSQTSTNTSADTNATTSRRLTETEAGFAATASYAGNTTWDYNIEGELPSPCYGYESDVQVGESIPEQVLLTLRTTEPAPEEVCAQQIQTVNATGTYQASEAASFTFLVATSAPAVEQ